MNPKTSADLLFESYLLEHGRDDFIYEQLLPESAKPPDYQLPTTGKPLLFEVKGFAREVSQGFGYFDPYAPVRKKIDKAIEKFRDLADYSCSLVLYNDSPGLVVLDPIIVFGGMLGDIAFEMPFTPASSLISSEAQQVFRGRGRMIQYAKGGHPEKAVNTTINAIIVLEQYPLGQRRFGRRYNERKAARAEALGAEEQFAACYAEVRAARGSDYDVSLHVVRVVVIENPYARVPLVRDLFIGPCDERYGEDENGRLVRLYAGDTVAEFEAPWGEVRDDTGLPYEN